MHRHRMSNSKSKRTFRSGASNVHPMNHSYGSKFVMRGGIRL